MREPPPVDVEPRELARVTGGAGLTEALKLSARKLARMRSARRDVNRWWDELERDREGFLEQLKRQRALKRILDL